LLLVKNSYLQSDKTGEMKYTLRKNKIASKDGDTYIAMTTDYKTYSREDLVEQICKREGSILKTTETRAVLDVFFDQLADNLEQGIAYKDDFFSLRTNIKGVFTDEYDKYDPSRHSLKASLSQGKELKQRLAGIKPRKAHEKNIAPEIMEVINLLDPDKGTQMDAGQVIELKGERLKFNEDDKEQGVFLESITGHRKTYRLVKYRRIMPSGFYCFLPEDIPEGEYMVYLKAQTRRSSFIRRSNTDIKLSLTAIDSVAKA